mgnify:CR=1 FL=1
MRLPNPPGYRPVAHTCPTIDRARHLAGALPPSKREEVRDLLEQVRADNIQLRANAAAWETQARRLHQQHTLPKISG